MHYSFGLQHPMYTLSLVSGLGLSGEARPQAEHLSTLERIGLFFGVGVITGTIGINYSHELMHQKNQLER